MVMVTKVIGVFEITLSSKEAIMGLKLLLLRFDIQSRVSGTMKCATNTTEKIKRKYYRLSIYDTKNLKKLADAVNSFLIVKKDQFFVKVKKSNTNVDVVPYVGLLVNEVKNSIGITFNELGQHPSTFFKIKSGLRELSKGKLQDITKSYENFLDNNSKGGISLLEFENISKLQKLADSDIFWDPIRSMSLIETDLFDFEVENTHTLVVSSGVIVHNSMLGQALAELSHSEKIVDILSFPNPADENVPLIRTISKGEGKALVTKQKMTAASSFKTQNIILFIIIIGISLIPYYFWKTGAISDVIYASSMISSMVFCCWIFIIPKSWKENEVK